MSTRAEEGRSSIDAMVIAAAAMFLVLLGFSPFSFDTSSVARRPPAARRRGGLFALVAICFFKQRVMHGTIGFFVFPIAIYGACADRQAGLRLGAPPLRRARPDKQAEAEPRFPPDRHTERLKNAFRDLVGGKPSEGVAAAKDEAVAATREAAQELRHQAERVTHPGGRQDG